MSESRGKSIWPRPPSSLEVLRHARCEKCESTEIPRTWALSSKKKINAELCTFELGDAFAEADDLSGADVGEVEGVEEKDHVVALVVGEFDVGEGVVGVDGDGFEAGGGVARHEADGCQD